MADTNHKSETGEQNGEATRALLSVARVLLPMVENYGRSREAEAACEAANDPKNAGKPRPIRPGSDDSFSDDEKHAFGMAFARMLAEGAELAASGSQTAVPHVKYNETTGRYPAPSIIQLGRALSRLRGSSRGDPSGQMGQTMQMMMMSSQPAGAEGQVVGEPVMISQPMMAPPAPPAEPIPAAPAPVRVIRRGPTTGSRSFAPAPIAPVRTLAPTTYTPGCGCASCAPPAPIATRNADGDCEPNPFEISCETQIRLKQCLLTIICDFLRCLDRELCVNGKLDFSNLLPALIECLGEALCTLLRCVPDALCPPTPPNQQLCHPEPNHCLPCDFAVEGAKS